METLREKVKLAHDTYEKPRKPERRYSSRAAAPFEFLDSVRTKNIHVLLFSDRFYRIVRAARVY